MMARLTKVIGALVIAFGMIAYAAIAAPQTRAATPDPLVAQG